MINLLDLFSGIGGFSLASSWVGGYQTVGFCEIEEFCRDLLKKNFPGVPVFKDIKELHPEDVIKQGEVVHLMSSGFPCQDLSVAGVQKGITAERSGLFFEIMRLSDEFYTYSGFRPALLLENVPNILSGGKGEWARLVYREVASRGYDCEWKIVSAKDLGAPHLRKRWWCIAYVANSNGSAAEPSFSRENDTEAAEKECVREGDSASGDSSGTGDDVRGGTSFRYEGKQNVAYPFCRTSRRRGVSQEPENERRKDPETKSESIQPRNRTARSGNTQPGSKNVAYSSSIRCQEGADFRGEIPEEIRGAKSDLRGSSPTEDVAYSESNRDRRETRNLLQKNAEKGGERRKASKSQSFSKSQNVADSNCTGQQQSDKTLEGGSPEQPDSSSVQPGENVPNSNSNRLQGGIQDRILDKEGREEQGIRQTSECSIGREGERDSQGEFEPGLGGVVNGISTWLYEPDIPRVTTVRENRVKRLKALGNSIVPQVAMIPLIRFREIFEEQNKT